MNLNYSGSGIVVYNKKEYQCDLYINENQGGVLIKISMNKIFASILELPFNIGFLSGELNTGYKFSLVNCSRNKMEDLISEGKSVYTYFAQYLFNGVGGKDINYVKLYKVVYELSDIIEWGNISGYAVGENYELIKNDDIENILFENKEFSVKYVVYGNMLPVHFTQVLKEEIRLKQNGNIEIIFKKKEEAIEKFEDIFRRINRLIELSTLRKIHLTKLTGWSTDIYDVYGEKRFDRAIDIISYDLKKDEGTKGNIQRVWTWIMLPALIENDSFKKYFDKYDLLEPVVDLYLEILKSKEMSTIRIFLNVVQALETYHSRFITNSIKEFKKRIKLVILKDRPEKFIDGDTKFIMANSCKFITLESRLADLLLAEFEIIFDTGDIKFLDFPNVISKTRNYYIHYDEAIKSNGRVLNEEEISIYNRTLLYMLEYYILRELGFSDTKQIRNMLNGRWGNASEKLSLLKASKGIEQS